MFDLSNKVYDLFIKVVCNVCIAYMLMCLCGACIRVYNKYAVGRRWDSSSSSDLDYVAAF